MDDDGMTLPVGQLDYNAFMSLLLDYTSAMGTPCKCNPQARIGMMTVLRDEEVVGRVLDATGNLLALGVLFQMSIRLMPSLDFAYGLASWSNSEMQWHFHQVYATYKDGVETEY
jgi:hypothetical protein